MYELPPILSGSAESQLRALRDYLVRLSQTLQTETTQLTAAQTGAVSPQLAAARAVDSNPTGSGHSPQRVLLAPAARLSAIAILECSAMMSACSPG